MNKKILGYLLRFLFAVFLLGIIFKRLDIGSLKAAVSRINIFIYSLSVLSFTLTIILSAVRWQLLLEFTKSLIPFKRLLIAYFVGLFAANYLPSGGIDIARGVYLFPNAQSRAQILASILVDRLLGFFAILGIVLIGLPFGLDGVRPYAPYLWGTVILLPLIYFISLLQPIYRFFIKVFGKIPFGGYLIKLYNAYYEYRSAPGLTIKALIMSFLIQNQFVFTAWLVALSVGVRLPYLESLFFISIINLLAMIPVTISGIGLREGGFVALFHGLLPPETAFVISLLYFGTSVINSLIGLPFLMATKISSQSNKNNP